MSYKHTHSITPAWIGQLNLKLYIAKKMKVIDRINYILDTLSTEYTQQGFTHSPRSVTVCVQRLWTILTIQYNAWRLIGIHWDY